MVHPWKLWSQDTHEIAMGPPAARSLSSVNRERAAVSDCMGLLEQRGNTVKTGFIIVSERAVD